MKWVRDPTGRFQRRPYYAQHEMDIHCEDVVLRFLRDMDRPLGRPLSTDDLTVLVERDVSELDLYANLSGEGRDVEGVTEFHPKRRPAVRIARYLSEQPSRENRLRSTLAHEYGHVVFHNFLWTLDPTRSPSKSRRLRPSKCRRARIVVAPERDWMEWQAGYAGGALLMPITAVRELVDGCFDNRGIGGRVEADTEGHRGLVARLAERFGVSNDAAKTRLLKLGYVTPDSTKQAVAT